MLCHQRPLHTPPYILIVDDDPAIARLVERTLAGYSYQFRSAATAERAYDLIAEDMPDTLILDVQLPGINGMEALLELSSRYPCLPIIIHTSHSTPGLALEALHNGAYDFWPKPYRPEFMQLGVLRAINYRRQLIERDSHVMLLAQHRARLNRARNTLLAIERTALLGHLTQGLMHEIFNPLTAIKMQAFHLKRELDGDPDIVARVEAIEEAADRIHQAIDALGASLPEEEEPGPVQIGAVVEDAIRAMRDTGELGEYQITTDLPPDLPVITGRAAQYQLVIEIILQNIVEAMRDLPAAGRQIYAQAVAGEGHIAVSIASLGPPLPDGHLKTLFDPRFTARPDKRRMRGLGMGLFMARNIVEASGGRLEAESSADTGVIFRVIFPVGGEGV